MEWILLFPIAAVAGLFGGVLIIMAWWSMSLLFGVMPPTPDQNNGILIGCIVVFEIGAAGLLSFAVIKG